MHLFRNHPSLCSGFPEKLNDYPPFKYSSKNKQNRKFLIKLSANTKVETTRTLARCVYKIHDGITRSGRKTFRGNRYQQLLIKKDWIIIRAVKHNTKNQQGLYALKRLVILQLGLTLLISIAVAAIFDVKTAGSALLGALVCVIPNICFGHMAFKHRGARAAKKIVSSFYKGEALKMILTIILFALVFINHKVVPLVFFLTYIIVQLAHWFLPLVLANKRNRLESD